MKNPFRALDRLRGLDDVGRVAELEHDIAGLRLMLGAERKARHAAERAKALTEAELFSERRLRQKQTGSLELQSRIAQAGSTDLAQTTGSDFPGARP